MTPQQSASSESEGDGSDPPDSDGDGVADDSDECIDDPRKTARRICGCHVPDTDTDGDGIVDCVDACPADNPDDIDHNGVCDSMEKCGDGTVSAFASEECDDGANGDDCDGCFDDCTDASSRIVREFAFVSNRDGDNEIFYDDGSGRLLQLTDNGVNDEQPSWSPDGRSILFVSGNAGDEDVYVMDANGGGPTRLTWHEGADHSPTWSPDGTRVAFVSERTGDAEIFVMNADGTNQTNLSVSPTSDDDGPQWSPDGTRIVYIRSTDSPYLVSVDAHGGDALRFDHLAAGGARWSPDGRWVVAALLDGSWTAAYWDAETTERHALFVDGSARIVRGIDWHPDSNRYAYVRQETDPTENIFELIVLDLEGTPLLQLRGEDMGSSTSGLIDWSPDGSEIAFVSNFEGNDELYAIDPVCGGNRKNLTQHPAEDTALAWRPQ